MNDPGYNPAFYSSISGSSTPSADAVIPLLLESLDVASVLDVGCGTGSWLAAFAAHGVTDLLGLERDEVPEHALQVPSANIVRTNLAEGFDLGRRFDLAICLEVAEHLPEQSSDSLVASLCAHSDVVLFSAAIPGQGGMGHINEQWQSYWASRFRERGYDAYDLVRPKVWNRPEVAYWYAQNALVYANEAGGSRLTRADIALDVVHPQLWQRELGLRELLHRLPTAVRRRLRR